MLHTIAEALLFTVALLAGVGLGMLLTARWLFARSRRRQRERAMTGGWTRDPSYQRGWADVGPRGLP